MKLKVPKTRKKMFKASSLNSKRIAKKFRTGCKIRRLKSMAGAAPAEGQPSQEGYMGMPFPFSQNLQVMLEEKARQEKEKGKKEIKYDGIPLPSGMAKFSSMQLAGLEESESLRNIDLKYPLIPQKPKQGETVYAYAHITWNEKIGSLVYNVVEQPVTAQDRKLVDKIKRNVEERLDVNFSKLGEVKAKELLRKEVQGSLSESASLNPARISFLQHVIEKEIIGLDLIEPLMKDPEIEDISCDGEKIPIYVYHRNPQFGSLRTNIFFSAKTDLDSFVLKLAQRCSKSISIAEPLLDAALPDGSRVQCTMGTDIARRGSNFTIRKFTFYPLTPTHMMQYKTLNSMQLAYLWMAIENGKSILISGGTATGKTSLLNALSLFIKPNLKILSIEDTPELRLPHTHWVPEVARSPLSVKGKVGEVTLFDLLKSSLRQRPDFLVVGEVRGREAFVLFQQMATGHPSLATIHAATFPQLIDRLITPPISLPPALIENVDIIVFIQRVKVGGKDVRRAVEIREVVGIDGDRPQTVKVFDWVPIKDEFVSGKDSKVLHSVARMSGHTEETVQAEILRRRRVLDYMHNTKMFDYNNVSRLVNGYYINPERVVTYIEETT